MKIITGFLKGKQIKDYNIDGTRPTMDRVKESIFSSIQNHIKDSVVLDLFAGTGNLGIEAISEGAKECYFIDNNISAINVIKKNINNFNISDKSYIYLIDYKKYLKTTDKKYDVIFLDPPYKMKVIDKILEIINERDLLNKNGIIIYEYEGDFIKVDNFNVIKEKKYGKKKVTVLKKVNL